METSLHNHDLIWNLCSSHDVQLSHPTCEDSKAPGDEDGEKNGNHTLEAGVFKVDSSAVAGQDKKGTKEGESRDQKKCPNHPCVLLVKNFPRQRMYQRTCKFQQQFIRDYIKVARSGF